MAPLDHSDLSDRGVANINVPLGGQVMSVVISLAAVTVLTLFLTQRYLVVSAWRRLPFVVWLVFAIYVDSYAFVFATSILQHSLGVNSSFQLCESAILLCLAFYVTTKFIYLFLVEKAYIIRRTTKRRMRSRLYLFNTFGMLSIYIVVVILNFMSRITKLENGQCIIGMKSAAMIPLISFDAVVNVYLTIIFLIPLKNLYSFKNMPRTPANLRLRTAAFRTFVGAACTLISSVANLSVLMALNVLFSALVIQWVTSKDTAGTSSISSNHQLEPQAPHQGSLRTSVCRIYSNDTGPGCAPPSPAAQALVRQHCSDRRASAASSDSPPQLDSALAKPLGGGVVITTTIRRESRPNDENLCSASDDEGSSAYNGGEAAAGSMRGGYRGSRRMSVGPLGEGFILSRTRITGGGGHPS